MQSDRPLLRRGTFVDSLRLNSCYVDNVFNLTPAYQQPACGMQGMLNP